MDPLRIDIQRRPVRAGRLLPPLHSAWGFKDRDLCSLCRRLVAARCPDGPAYTWDGKGYGMRIDSIHHYAEWTVEEDGIGGYPLYRRYRPSNPGGCPEGGRFGSAGTQDTPSPVPAFQGPISQAKGG
ncbi:hypothetical protein FFK22_014435 [Mycobacterium sp. KBS0706]|uniref:hypothetical protein n=1 Tax=Mycobacterium sp. KBS0706 TaxID=2578109 RepID=UPI00110FBEF9|nr:hypothetical protein [Mycobacterium sp. KBS0706]TSD88031.1 hypothetical protein FFK22_014435 [Mycobacterium sp. KBS0706]